MFKVHILTGIWIGGGQKDMGHMQADGSSSDKHPGRRGLVEPKGFVSVLRDSTRL